RPVHQAIALLRRDVVEARLLRSVPYLDHLPPGGSLPVQDVALGADGVAGEGPPERVVLRLPQLRHDRSLIRIQPPEPAEDLLYALRGERPDDVAPVR